MDLLTFDMLRAAKFAEGAYSYRLSNVEAQHDVPTNYGMRDRVVFTFELTVEAGLESLVQRFTVSQSPNSRYMQFMTMLCSAYHTTKLNLRELIGTTGVLTVSHSQDERGNIFENVVSMQPNPKGTEERGVVEHEA